MKAPAQCDGTSYTGRDPATGSYGAPRQCQLPGRYEHEGKHYCGTHLRYVGSDAQVRLIHARRIHAVKPMSLAEAHERVAALLARVAAGEAALVPTPEDWHAIDLATRRGAAHRAGRGPGVRRR